MLESCPAYISMSRQPGYCIWGLCLSEAMGTMSFPWLQRCEGGKQQAESSVVCQAQLLLFLPSRQGFSLIPLLTNGPTRQPFPPQAQVNTFLGYNYQRFQSQKGCWLSSSPAVPMRMGTCINYRLTGDSESVGLVWVQESLFLTNASVEYDEQLGLKQTN